MVKGGSTKSIDKICGMKNSKIPTKQIETYEWKMRELITFNVLFKQTSFAKVFPHNLFEYDF